MSTFNIFSPTESMEQKPETNPLPQSIHDNLFIANTLINVGLRTDGIIDRRFRDLVDTKIPANPKSIEGVSSYDVSIDPCWFRVFVPDVPAHSLPVIVYYHGGGFAFYGPDSAPFDGLCRRFASKIQAIVVSASYRLIPEHRYPTQYEDGFNVLKFLDDDQITGKTLPKNADLRHCFVFGDSAGGNLAHHVCIRASQYTFKQLKVIGLVTLQPYFGGEQRAASELSAENRLGLHLNQTDFYWNIFQPIAGDEKWDRDNEVINVSGPRAADISGLDFPTTLVVVGGRDILEDWQRNYYAWLKKSGKEAYIEEYEYMFHGFYTFPELAEARHVISAVKDFVNKQIKLNIRLPSRL